MQFHGWKKTQSRKAAVIGPNAIAGEATARRRSRKRLFGQRGQGLVEYILIVAVIISVVIIVAKPFFKTFQEKIGENLKNGSVFSDSPNFYYFPVRRSGG